LTGVVGVKDKSFRYFDMDTVSKTIRRDYQIISNKVWNLNWGSTETFMETEYDGTNWAIYLAIITNESGS